MCLVTQSYLTFCDPWTVTLSSFSQVPLSMGILQQKYWSFHALFKEIFPTQVSNPGLPHCRQILYQLSHKRSPRILGWVDYPFSSQFSQAWNRTRVSYIAGGFFTN